MFAAGITALKADGRQLLSVDLDGVTFLDATGLGALIRLRTAARDSAHDLVLRDPSDRVIRLLELTGLVDTFQIARKAGA